jgi:predicted transcriptional regulator
MSRDQIEEILARVRTWPADWQEDAVSMLLAMEKDLANPYELTEEEERDLDAGVAEADRGEFVPDEEVEAFFARFR